MLIKTLRDIAAFTAGDGSALREIFHPVRDGWPVRCSLARAAVPAGRRTLPHRLKSAEVYLVLEGRGLMRVGEESAEIGPGQAVCVPPAAVQSVESLGPGDLVFLCLVDPAWRAEDEEIL